MDLMLRRRAMMAAGSATSGPLYQLRQGSSTRSGRNTTITGAHVLDKNTGGTTGARNNYISGSSRSDAAITSTWFSLHAGDVVVIKMRNITGKNNYASGSADYYVRLASTDGTSIVQIASFSMARGFDGTIADKQATATLSADVNAGSVYFYAQRASVLEYDLELWVNDVRYL